MKRKIIDIAEKIWYDIKKLKEEKLSYLMYLNGKCPRLLKIAWQVSKVEFLNTRE